MPLARLRSPYYRIGGKAAIWVDAINGIELTFSKRKPLLFYASPLPEFFSRCVFAEEKLCLQPLP